MMERDVRHDAEGKHSHPAQVAAAKEIHQPKAIRSAG